MTALNSELQSNYGAIGRLKSSMKEVSSCHVVGIHDVCVHSHTITWLCLLPHM